MKRDNLIMPAYIGAVLLSIGIRLFWNYTMWRAIVAAVTCSSACFSISDYASIYASDIKNQNELISNFSKDILYLCKNIQRLCTEKLEEHKDETKNSLKKLLTIFRDFTNELKEKHEKRLADAEKERVQIQHLEIVANSFTVLGFFLFFCLVFFPEISNIIVSILDILSVSSFAVILLTQYLTASRKEKYQRNAKKYEQIYECWENILKDLEEIDYHAD